MAGSDDDHLALLDQTGRGTWAGWLGYRLGRRLERLPPERDRPVPRPPAALARFETVCRCDAEGRWWLESVIEPAQDEIERWQARLRPAPEPLSWSAGKLTVTPDRPNHIGAVEEAVLRIAAGELYQANVCLRLEWTFAGSALHLWCAAGARLRPGRAAFVATDEGAVCSLSPEVFLLRHGERVRSEPIKGTRRLTDAGRSELIGDPKDRAEHVMIVDLVRNDLGRVCAAGSVHVPRLAEAEPLAGVWHLVSTVDGTLADGRNSADVLRACFPPGSVTGAPKVAAEALCCRLEPTAREAYCGAVGLASPDHGLELNVAIRTFEVAGGRLWLGVGGGVVADSDGVAEWDECLAKAAPLLAAAGLPAWEEATGAELRSGACFETVLVVDGEAVEAKGHLVRFQRSTGLDAEPALQSAVARLGHDTWRVRVDEAGGGTTKTSVLPAPRPPVLDGGWGEVEVALVTFPGGLGNQKWADRGEVQALEERHHPLVPVLCDEDGSVLEATWANLFAVIEERLCTPPLDGRILPGVTRRALLDEAVDLGVPLRIGPIDVEQLLAADTVMLTSAIHGLVTVRAIEGLRRFGTPHEIVPVLTGALGRRWSPSRQRPPRLRKML